MKIQLLIPSFILLALAACEKKAAPAKTDDYIPDYTLQLAQAAWLLGNWGSTTAEGRLVENWRKVDEMQFNGESYFIVDKDTVFAETVVLEQVVGKVSFTVTVPGQNDEMPVRFDLTSITDDQMVFENPKHDYPSKIIYQHVGNDSLIAEISGVQKGKPAKELFKMKRKP